MEFISSWMDTPVASINLGVPNYKEEKHAKTTLPGQQLNSLHQASDSIECLVNNTLSASHLHFRANHQHMNIKQTSSII